MKKIVILGSTGEIGSRALEVVDAFPDELKVVGLSSHRGGEKFDQQVAKYRPQQAVISSQNPGGLIKLATLAAADLIVVSVVGTAGLAPTIAAIEAKKNVALATKEVLVIAGELVFNLAKKNRVEIIPIDSEHSALSQSLRSGNEKEIKNIYLTMGSGDIARLTPEQMSQLSPTQVTQVNQWQMGQKITVDSATCVNKLFEAIEAARFFNLSASQIKIVVHPEYICHSLVEFVDGSLIGEFGTAQMSRYLQYALLHPKRLAAVNDSYLDLMNKQLSFLAPNTAKFPILNLLPSLLTKTENGAIFHGADRLAVEMFLQEKIKFTDIYTVIKKTLETLKTSKKPKTLNDYLEIEEQAYQKAKKLAESNYVQKSKNFCCN